MVEEKPTSRKLQIPSADSNWPTARSPRQGNRMTVQEPRTRSSQTHTNPSTPSASPPLPGITHGWRILEWSWEPSIPAAFPVIPRHSVPPQIGINSQQNVNKSGAKPGLIASYRHQKISQATHSVEDRPQKQYPPPGVLLLSFAFRQLRPHFQFMQLP
jgi:hypothetical protein